MATLLHAEMNPDPKHARDPIVEKVGEHLARNVGTVARDLEEAVVARDEGHHPAGL